MYKLIYCFVVLFIIESCSSSSTKKKETLSSSSSEYLESDTQNESNSKSSTNSNVKSNIDLKRQLIKLSHHINTSANEYLPVLSADENDPLYLPNAPLIAPFNSAPELQAPVTLTDAKLPLRKFTVPVES